MKKEDSPKPKEEVKKAPEPPAAKEEKKIEFTDWESPDTVKAVADAKAEEEHERRLIRLQNPKECCGHTTELGMPTPAKADLAKDNKSTAKDIAKEQAEMAAEEYRIAAATVSSTHTA